MKKTMVKTFYIDEARKAEGKPFKALVIGFYFFRQ